jgi:ABC-type Fe3+-hydroxamate transport system substrate-binding protein
VPSATETLVALGANLVGCTTFCKRPGIPTVGGTKTPDLTALRALRPEVVVVDTEENRREHADVLRDAGIELTVTSVRSVGDAVAVVAQLAAAAGLDAPEASRRPDVLAAVTMTAFVPIWRRPWMTMSAGTYGSSLLARLGIANVFGDAAVRYPEVTLDDVTARRPDLVLLPTEPYPFKDRHLAEWADVAPARLLDGQDLFWWGTRTPSALDRLARDLAS